MREEGILRLLESVRGQKDGISTKRVIRIGGLSLPRHRDQQRRLLSRKVLLPDPNVQ